MARVQREPRPSTRLGSGHDNSNQSRGRPRTAPPICTCSPGHDNFQRVATRRGRRGRRSPQSPLGQGREHDSFQQVATRRGRIARTAQPPIFTLQSGARQLPTDRDTARTAQTAQAPISPRPGPGARQLPSGSRDGSGRRGRRERRSPHPPRSLGGPGLGAQRPRGQGEGRTQQRLRRRTASKLAPLPPGSLLEPRCGSQGRLASSQWVTRTLLVFHVKQCAAFGRSGSLKLPSAGAIHDFRGGQATKLKWGVTWRPSANDVAPCPDDVVPVAFHAAGPAKLGSESDLAPLRE